MRMSLAMRTRLKAAVGLGSALSLSLALAGCGTGSAPGTNGTATTVAAATSLHGLVHGGQQPISSAVIQLYAVGINGIKSASTPLIAQTVTTGTDGSFTITGDWNCTSNTAVYGSNPLLYITATGGNPGLGGATNNAAIVLIALLGPCSGVGASTDILLDEMTTVAAAYALAPFMQDALHVGAQGANALGLVNAFQTAALLVDVASGSAPGASLPGNATAPVKELNTLGDMAAACVNSTGTGDPCATLFKGTTVNGNVPADIASALLSLASNPGAVPPSLLNLVPTQPPFQPLLPGPPADWTVALKFTGGGLNGPTGIALDASGNVWVANALGNSVTELSSAGTLLTGNAGYTGSNLLGAQGIAVDKNDNVWVADTLLSTVVELTTSSGVVQSSTSFTAGGISGPTALAVDSQNNVWVSNFTGGSVTELNNHGAVLGSSPLTAGGLLQSPVGIAIDAAGNVWVTDHQAGVIDEFANNQALLSGSGDTDGSMIAPGGVAINSNGFVWIADAGINATSLLNTSGSAVLTLPYTAGGLVMPAAVAIDGNGTAWVANSQAAGSISKLTYVQIGLASPATGLGSLNMPSGIAVDASGCVWTANAGDNSVSEFVGLAAPAVMPLAAVVGP
jgi:streptogramin lyase